jgi:uncharacterized membrane protein
MPTDQQAAGRRAMDARRAGFVLLALLSLGVAGYAAVMYTFVPLGRFLHPDMRAAFEANSVAIYGHVFASTVALALGPFQFLSRLRARRPALHRWLGRTYLAIGVLIGGLCGLYMSIHAFGGLVGKTGFTLLALAWLYTGLRAFAAIRGGDAAAHRRWMVRNFALAFAAVTLRIWLPLSVAAGAEFELAYPAIAWLCWLPNLVVAELLFNRARDAAAAPAGLEPGR